MIALTIFEFIHNHVLRVFVY